MATLVSSQSDAGSSSQNIFRRTVVFFALACAFTWWGFGIALVTGSDGWAQMFSIGPLIAALVVIGVTEGKAGLRAWWRRISHVRGPVRLYALAIGGASAIPLVSAGLALLAGADMPESGRWLSALPAAIILIVPVAFLFGPVGEEPAFRGWAQERLQARMSTLRAALLIGAGVIVWHLPLFVTGDIPWTVVIALPAVSVVYAWFIRASGTVWTAIALHTSMNVVSGIYLGEVFDGQAANLRIGFVAAFYVVWAVYLVYRYGTSLAGREAPATSTTVQARSTVVAAPAAR